MEIPVVFTTDNGYAIPTCVAIASLVVNKDSKTAYKIHILITDDLSPENRGKLTSCKAENVSVELISCSLDHVRDRPDYKIASDLCLLKFDIADMFPQYDKLLYLDGDIIVKKDLAELYNIELENNFLAAVSDMPIVKCNENIQSFKYFKDLNLSNYFNAGVMLLNTKAIRDEKLKNIFYSKKDNANYCMADQDVFNVVCKDRVRWLPFKYNNMAANIIMCGLSIKDINQYYGINYKTIGLSIQDSCILHLNGPIKPWKYRNAFLGKEWMSYYKKSVFKSEKLKLNRVVYIRSLAFAARVFKWFGKNIRQNGLFGTSRLFAEKVSAVYIEKFAKKKILTQGKSDFFDGLVSIIIPIYNGGDELKQLIAMLKAQKKVRQIEIIAIDSGSTDGSVEFLKQEGINLTEIAKSDFSHSGTRNLGAEKASGGILLFMTQDALPLADDWVFKMALPIVDYGVAAASCIERVRENSSLFAVLINEGARQYYCANQGDRINRLPKNKKDIRSLHRNASLCDVACAIRKDVFAKFIFRGEYAEDMDLGLRLLQAGYALAFLSTIDIIHSHERSCSYYLRRAYVDATTTKKILPDFYLSENSLEKVLCSAFFAYYQLQILFAYIQSLQGDLDVYFFFNLTMHQWREYSGNIMPDKGKPAFGLWYSDTIVDDFLRVVLINYPGMCLVGNSCVDEMRHYFDVRFRDYAIANLNKINADLRLQLIDAMYKNWVYWLAHNIGLYFSEHPDTNNPLFISLEEVSKGI